MRRDEHQHQAESMPNSGIGMPHVVTVSLAHAVRAIKTIDVHGRRRIGILRSASLLAMILLCGATVRADTVDGWVATGISGAGHRRVSPIVEARVEYESGRHKGAEARIEVGGDSYSRRMEIKDASVDVRDLVFGVDLEVGRGKKILGWEYEDKRELRLTLERSMVYRFLESASLVGRDVFLAAEHGPFRGGLHTDAVGNFAMTLCGKWTRAAHLVVATWALVQRDHYTEELAALTWVVASGVKWTADRHRAVAEILVGVDPYQSELNAAYGGAGKVYFAAAKAEYGIALGPATLYVQGAVLLPDLDSARRSNLQGLFGTRVVIIDGLLVAGEVEALGNDSVSMATSRIWSGPTIRLQLRYFFS